MIFDYLYDWQKDIVNKVKDRNSYGIYLDMGLGKSPISLSLAEVNECNKIIIISINSKALENEEVNGSFFWWLKKSDIEYNLYNKKYNFRKEGPIKYQAEINYQTKDVLLLNYESLYSRKVDRDKKVQLKENLIDFINSCNNHNVALIIDESHKTKTLNSMQTMAVQLLQNKLSINNNVYTYLLSGTPFTAGFIDFYSQLKLLGCSINKSQFLNNFCIRGNYPSLLPYQQPIVDYKNLDKLFELIHKYAITTKTSDVIKLPEQIFVEHKLQTSREMKLFTHEKLYKDDINSELKKRNLPLIKDNSNGRINNPFFRNIAYPDFVWSADTSANFWLRSRELSIGFQGNAKEAQWYNKNRLNELERFLEQNEDNYILFYNYTPEFIEIYEICEKLGYKIDVYNGEIKDTRYYDSYCKLSEGQKLVENKRIIISNFSSGSTGKNWQEYSKCILFSIPIFRDYEQGIKRIHRIGQKETVVYHIFYENNWLDKSMLDSLKNKQDYDSKLFLHHLEEEND